MDFGVLYFDEVIGKSTTIQKIEIDDPDVPLPDHYINGVLTINKGGVVSKNLERRTWVRVYPDADYAARAVKGIDIHSTKNFYVPGEVDSHTSSIGGRPQAITEQR